jgi:tetratricopeptide (TPR) repeat protein
VLALGLAACGAWFVFRDHPLDRAERHYRAGAWREAALEAGKALAANPGQARATFLLARSEARLGRDRTARNLYLQLDPSRYEAEDYFLVARGLIGSGQIDEGRLGLERALALDPSHAETLRDLIRLNRRVDRLSDAAEQAEKLAALPSWEARGSVLLGLVKQAQGDPRAAGTAFRAAIARDPRIEDSEAPLETVQKALVRSLLQTGQPSEARAALDAIGSERPFDPEDYWLKSRAALQQRDLAAASEALSHAAGFALDRPEAFEPAPFVGITSCQECHPKIFRAQRSSRHAQTFRARGDLRDMPRTAKPRPDPASAEVTHSVAPRGDDLVFRTHSPGGDLEAVVAFVMGSGDRAMTLVGRDPQGSWRELRMSYYGSITDWDRTTGHLTVPQAPLHFLGLPQTADTLRRCLGCHTTGARVSPDGTGVIATQERGFHCERCHGPAGNHLIAVEAKFSDPAIGRPRLASPAPLNALCGQCHSAEGRGVTADDPNLARFQVTALAMSRCTMPAGEPLSCLACHSPHHNAETSPAFYEAKCLECHAAGASSTHQQSAPVACPVSPARGCVSCHMPKVQTDVPHTTFTAHLIRAKQPAKPAGAKSPTQLSPPTRSSAGSGNAP